MLIARSAGLSPGKPSRKNAPQSIPWATTRCTVSAIASEEAVAALGARRILFGSDYNLNHPAAFRAIIDALPLDEEGRADVLGANLNRLLPPPQRFF